MIWVNLHHTTLIKLYSESYQTFVMLGAWLYIIKYNSMCRLISMEVTWISGQLRDDTFHIYLWGGGGMGSGLV